MFHVVLRRTVTGDSERSGRAWRSGKADSAGQIAAVLGAKGGFGI